MFERLIAFLVVLAVLFWLANVSDGLPWSVPEASVEADLVGPELAPAPQPAEADGEQDEDDEDEKDEDREKERKKKGRGGGKRGRG